MCQCGSIITSLGSKVDHAYWIFTFFINIIRPIFNDILVFLFVCFFNPVRVDTHPGRTRFKIQILDYLTHDSYSWFHPISISSSENSQSKKHTYIPISCRISEHDVFAFFTCTGGHFDFMQIKRIFFETWIFLFF